MAFCTTLRRRASFAAVVPKLTADGFLKENSLVSHDISITLPTQQLANHEKVAASPRRLHYLLLSPHAVVDDNRQTTIHRIHRFVALTGGADLRIIFLLELSASDQAQSTVTKSQVQGRLKGLMAYTQLQILLLDQIETPLIPILPLASLMQLPTLLKNHTSASNQSPTCSSRPAALTPWTFLRQCTMNPPMQEVVAYFITDTFANLEELALACGLEDSSMLSDEAVNRYDGSKSAGSCVSPYFSSSATPEAVGSLPEQSSLLQKLRSLFAFDRDAARDVVTFWRAEWLLT